jgi:hypothetical protein
MRRLVVVAAAMIVLPASAVRADDIPVQTRAAGGASTSAVPAIGSSCLINRSALASGRLVRAGRDSVTVAVEDGSGTARAFIGARLLLPVAPNARRPRGRLRWPAWGRRQRREGPAATRA